MDVGESLIPGEWMFKGEAKYAAGLGGDSATSTVQVSAAMAAAAGVSGACRQGREGV